MTNFISYRGWKVSRCLTAAYRGGHTMYFYGENLHEIKRLIDSYWA